MRKLSANQVRDWGSITPAHIKGAFRATAKCTGCGKTTALDFRTNASPDWAFKKFDQLGWKTIGRMKCPECAKPPRKEKEPPAMSNKTLSIVPPPAQAQASAPAQAPAPIAANESAAPAAKKKMRELIALTFDDATGRYEAGYSDERIAADTGLSEAFVSKYREEFHGQLMEPDDVAAVRSEIDALRLALGASLDGLQVKLDALCLKHRWGH